MYRKSKTAHPHKHAAAPAAGAQQTQLAGSSPPSCLVLPCCPAPGPLPLPLPSQQACSTHDVTGKACHCPQVTFPVSAGQQSQKGKVWKVGKAGKEDPDSCILLIYFLNLFLIPLSAFLAFVTRGGSSPMWLVPILRSSLCGSLLTRSVELCQFPAAGRANSASLCNECP